MIKPTVDQIYRAALKWCGEKDRETFPDDILYFQNNWWALPGLRRYVEAAVEEQETEAKGIIALAKAHTEG